ncbi:Histone deacetylase 3 [Glugoides intestinalis]
MYDETIGLHSYGKDHPMNPFRITMTHSLVKSYNLEQYLDLYIPSKVSNTFHSEEYINSIGVKETLDCPVFENITDFCERYASASVNGALLLNSGLHNCVVNWAGGLHHAKKEEASGFCFVNDIVMAILELLSKHERVMYIDVDVHHGDGVEEAFLDNDRVLTVSFHKYGDGFFPDTGTLITSDWRVINVPLQNGIDDASYKYIFEPVITNAIKKFKPDAIVYQSGADSLAEDKLGTFNLSIAGHAECLSFVTGFGIPMLVLGGGGYTIHNVARCWAYETAVLCGKKVPDMIPETDPFRKYFEPNYETNPIFYQKHQNQNKKKYLDSLIGFIQERVDSF